MLAIGGGDVGIAHRLECLRLNRGSAEAFVSGPRTNQQALGLHNPHRRRAHPRHAQRCPTDRAVALEREQAAHRRDREVAMPARKFLERRTMTGRPRL